jgi:hypothetical protein
MTTRILQKVLRAFGGDNWESLLFYVTNNVALHKKHATHARSNKRDRQSMYRDKVYQETLLRSTLVKHVVVSFNQVGGNSRSARDERRRILSIIACDFPLKTLQGLGWKIPDVGTKYKNRSLTKHQVREAKAHAGAFGPGGHPVIIPQRRSVTISEATITAVYKHIMTGENVQKLAAGTNELVLTTGETYTIPPVARKYLMAHMWAAYARLHTDDNGNYNGALSRTDFFEIIACSTSEQEKCYSALDQIKVRYGSENFEAGFELVQDLCRLDPIAFTGYEEMIKGVFTEVKMHCKNELVKHLCTLSKCGNHCLTHLFGGQGRIYSNECVECDGHPERCRDCEQGHILIAMIQAMLNQVKDLGTVADSTIADLQWRLDK